MVQKSRYSHADKSSSNDHQTINEIHIEMEIRRPTSPGVEVQDFRLSLSTGYVHAMTAFILHSKGKIFSCKQFKNSISALDIYVTVILDRYSAKDMTETE